jgi:hypothetical protein
MSARPWMWIHITQLYSFLKGKSDTFYPPRDSLTHTKNTASHLRIT